MKNLQEHIDQALQIMQDSAQQISELPAEGGHVDITVGFAPTLPTQKFEPVKCESSIRKTVDATHMARFVEHAKVFNFASVKFQYLSYALAKKDIKGGE